MNILNATASFAKETSTAARRFWPKTWLLALALVPFAHSATDTPPNRMTVQSYITDDTGTPLGNTTAVNKKMVFVLYTADTGGTVEFADEQIVTVDAGHFSVVLGEGSPVGDENHDLAIAFSGDDASDRFIEIQVSDTDGSNPQTLSPRLRLLPSAYSFLAAYANEAARVTGGGIDTAAISESAVTSDKVANESLTAADLAPNSVGSSEVINESLTQADLAPNSVGNSEIAENITLSGNAGVNVWWPNVTMGLRSQNSGDYMMYGLNSAGSNVFWLNSAATLWTQGGLAGNMVNSAAIVDGSITANDLATNSVAAAEIAADAVGASEIAANAVGTSELAPRIQFEDYAGVNKLYNNVSFTIRQGSGDTYLIYAENAAGTKVFDVNSAGITTTAFGIVTFSDRVLKRNIEPMDGALGKVMRLSPKTYHYKDQANGQKHYGFVAQEVQDVYPEMVIDGGDYLGLTYQAFGAVAISAIQELNTKVESLEDENAALADRLAALEALVQSLAR